MMHQVRQSRLSVVVIAYNNELYIREALESLLEQTYDNLEIVVVNDASTDSTGDIIDDFVNGRPNFKAIHLEENSGGCSTPRNTGINNSTGEYIMFLDGDDWYTNDACEKMVVALNKSHSDFVAGQVIRTNNYEIWYHNQIYSKERNNINVREFPMLLFDSLSVNKIYKRSFLDRHSLRFPEGIHYEDIVFTGKAYFLADSVSVIPEPIYYWRVVEDANVKSITNQRSDYQNFKNRINAHRQLDDFIKKNNYTLYQPHKNNKFLRHDLKLYTNDYKYFDEEYKNKFNDLVYKYLNDVMDEYSFIYLPEPERIMYYLLYIGDREGFEDFIRYKDGLETTMNRVYSIGKQYYFHQAKDTSNEEHEKFLKLKKPELQYELKDIVLKDHIFSFTAKVNLFSIEKSNTNYLWRLKNKHTGEIIYAENNNKEKVSFNISEVHPGNYYLTLLIKHMGVVHKKLVKLSEVKGSSNLQVNNGNLIKRVYVNYKNSLAIKVIPQKRFNKIKWFFKIRKPISQKGKRSLLSVKLRKVIYKIIENLPVNRKWIIFESHMGKQYSDSPKYIYAHLYDKNKKYKYIWSFENPNSINIPGPAVKVKRNSLRHYYYLNRAKFWVDNQGLVHLAKKKSNQVYLQTWHGTPLKKMGFDQKTSISKIGINRLELQKNAWDYFISQNPYSTKIFKKAFRYSGEILETGYPRNDILLNYPSDLVVEIKQNIRVSNSANLILYAPTFRDWDKDGFQKMYNDILRISSNIDSQTVLLLRLHYLLSEQMANITLPHNVIDVSKYQDVQELYIVTDILITDYSSVMFDYSILKRPIIFYCYDLEEYTARRGLYFNLHDNAPGPLCFTIEDVLNFILSPNYLDSYKGRLEQFNQEFAMHEDGNATIKVVEKVFN